MSTENKEPRNPFDGEYLGNIWGWKISLFGLAVIVFFSSLIAYRHLSLGIPFRMEDPVEEQQGTVDTIRQESIHWQQ